jgi:hypothetical protein
VASTKTRNGRDVSKRWIRASVREQAKERSARISRAWLTTRIRVGFLGPSIPTSNEAVFREEILLMLPALIPLALALLAADLEASAPAGKPFTIEVVDDQTGRGVPLVELRTVNGIVLVTDSNGLATFDEPGLMDQKVFFHVKSHGYEFPKDGFGYRGQALDVRVGGSARIRIKRINVAERLYRVTGEGIYRETVLACRKPPIARPLLNARVFGSDSVVNALYRGKVHWFWGDTNRPGYPLGNFHVPGATSRLPADGGLDPEVGVDLDYFVGPDGFARPTAQLPGEGPTWIFGLVVLREASGPERMFATYMKVRPPMEVYERGLVEFDPEKQRFERVATFPKDAPVYPDGQAFLRKVESGVEYVYFASPFPLIRVKADAERLAHLDRYEAYTCLLTGGGLADPRIDRDADGLPRYSWKTNTAAVGPQDQARLVRAGVLKQEETLLQLRDIATGKPVVGHAGSLAWNEHRQRWVLIAVEVGGTSFLGEVWYAEADTPLGPWVYARKVVTHDRYSFYNPKQHPYFAKENGRIIFFEGTYAQTFSGNPEATPRYDYNQVMYKLNLDDPRLNLPVAVYREPSGAPGEQYVVSPQRNRAKRGGRPEWFALDRESEDTVPVWLSKGDDVFTLKAGALPRESQDLVWFHAIPPEAKNPPAGTVPLWEYERPGSMPVYSTEESLPDLKRRERPVCRVWPNPMRLGVPIDRVLDGPAK